MKDTFLTTTLLWLTLLFPGCLVADDGNLEDKIKAGYLYNFTKFVTWPEIKGTDFNLCLLSNDPFGVVIGPIEKKSAFTLPIKVIKLDEAKDIQNSILKSNCQILYVGSGNGQKTDFERIKGSLQKMATLIVGEGEEFAAEGGMIGFANRDGKIKLKINLEAAKLAGLKISAKLLEVAELIKEENHD